MPIQPTRLPVVTTDRGPLAGTAVATSSRGPAAVALVERRMSAGPVVSRVVSGDHVVDLDGFEGCDGDSIIDVYFRSFDDGHLIFLGSVVRSGRTS